MLDYLSESMDIWNQVPHVMDARVVSFLDRLDAAVRAAEVKERLVKTAQNWHP